MILALFAGIAVTRFCKAAEVSVRIVYSHETDAKDYSWDGGSYELTEIGPDGVKNLARPSASSLLGAAIREPRYSPDGKYIIFLADIRDRERTGVLPTGSAAFEYSDMRLWKVTAGEEPLLLTRSSLDCAWKPVTFLNNRAFTTVKASQGSIDRPTPEELYNFVQDVANHWNRKFLRREAQFIDVSSSPFSSHEVIYPMPSGLIALDVLNNNARTIFPSGGDPLGYDAFSPDGRYLFLVRGSAEGWENLYDEIFDMRTQKVVATLHRPTSDLAHGQWCDVLNGFVTCYSSYGDKKSFLMLLTPAGEQKCLLTIPGAVGVVHVTAPGPYVVLDRVTEAGGKLGPEDIWAYDAATNKLILIAHSSRPIHGFDVFVKSRGA